MPKFNEAVVTGFSGFELGVQWQYIEKIGQDKQALPDSLLLVSTKTGEVIGVGDFFSADECATLEPLDVAREKTAQAFLDGMKKGMAQDSLIAVTEKDLSSKEIEKLVFGR